MTYEVRLRLKVGFPVDPALEVTAAPSQKFQGAESAVTFLGIQSIGTGGFSDQGCKARRALKSKSAAISEGRSRRCSIRKG